MIQFQDTSSLNALSMQEEGRVCALEEVQPATTIKNNVRKYKAIAENRIHSSVRMLGQLTVLFLLVTSVYPFYLTIMNNCRKIVKVTIGDLNHIIHRCAKKTCRFGQGLTTPISVDSNVHFQRNISDATSRLRLVISISLRSSSLAIIWRQKSFME